MEVIVNGQRQALPVGSTVGRLIEEHAPGARRIAVELNGEILPRSVRENHALQDGDRVEIVQAIGGG